MGVKLTSAERMSYLIRAEFWSLISNRCSQTRDLIILSLVQARVATYAIQYKSISNEVRSSTLRLTRVTFRTRLKSLARRRVRSMKSTQTRQIRVLQRECLIIMVSRVYIHVASRLSEMREFSARILHQYPGKFSVVLVSANIYYQYKLDNRCKLPS